MKRRHFIRAFSLCLGLMLSFSAFGCGDNVETDEYVETTKHEVLPVYKYTIKDIGEDVMPVLGFVGPHAGLAKEGSWIPSLNVEETYKDIKDAGVNIIQSFLDYDVIPEEVVKQFDFADKYGLKVLCYDTSLWDIQGKNYTNQAKVTARYQELAKHKGFLGINFDDEPFSYDLDDVKAVSNLARTAISTIDASRQIYYGNCLNPKWAYVKYDSGFPSKTYKQYLQDYIDAAKPNYIGYDFYPFLGVGERNKESIRNGYFENIVEAREIATKNQIPFWTYIQACTFDPDNVREPNEGEVWWNVNTCLAFGVKGFGIYTLCEPENYQTVHTSMIGLHGEKRSSYFFVQSALKQVEAIQSILINSANAGVIKNGDSIDTIPESVLLKEFRELKGVSGNDSIVGCFDYNGKTVLYVVNNSFVEDKAEVTLSFDNCYGYDVIQRGITRTTNGKELTLKLAAGEGALISLR